jgi:L-threonylcarbamoyladenylate synthase
VAVPTETVYGLAAAVDQPRAVRHIFRLKGRPADNPLIVHVASLAQLRDLVTEVPPSLRRLRRFWPGPLTVVLPANRARVPAVVRAGLSTVAVRIPAHPLMRRLIRAVGPLAAPSANVSGRPSPTNARHVESDLGRDFPVLDGGRCRHGVESTVIALTARGWSLLRAGAISAADLTRVLGKPPIPAGQGRARSPGQRHRHYAPLARLILCTRRAGLAALVKRRRAEAVLGFDDWRSVAVDRHIPLVSLGVRNRPAANLRRLYATLRRSDAKGWRRVVVDLDFDTAGLGATLAERLWRAAGAHLTDP